MKSVYITIAAFLISFSLSAQWSVTFDDHKSDVSGYWTLSKAIGKSITIDGTMPSKNLTSAWVDIVLINLDDWSLIEEIAVVNLDLSGNISNTINIPPATKSTLDLEKESYQYFIRVVGEYGGSSWQNRLAALDILPAKGDPASIFIGFNNKNQGMGHNESLPLKKQLPGSEISIQYEYSPAHYNAKPTKIEAKIMHVNASWLTVGKPLHIKSVDIVENDTKSELIVKLPADLQPSKMLPETDFYILQALVYYGPVPLYSIIKLDVSDPNSQQ